MFRLCVVSFSLVFSGLGCSVLLVLKLLWLIVLVSVNGCVLLSLLLRLFRWFCIVVIWVVIGWVLVVRLVKFMLLLFSVRWFSC